MRLSVSVSSEWLVLHFAIKRMHRLRIYLINLLGLCLILSEGHRGFCSVAIWQPPRPIIRHLQAISAKQSLRVSWLVNHSGMLGDIYEIQVGRTENYTVIYNRNVSLLSVDSGENTWTWTSDLPLECADHSVRIRHFYNQSFPSLWSNWTTNYGAQPKDKTEMFPQDRVLRVGSRGMFCCVPPKGVSVTSITFYGNEYPLISVGAGVKAITMDNLTIPLGPIKVLSLSCNDASGERTHVWNYVSFPPQKPRNLSCETSNMKMVTCSWDSSQEYLHDHNKQTQTLYIENSDQDPIVCEQLLCTFPADPQLEEYNIRVVVKNQLGEETERHSFNISDRVFPVVEWDRVSPGVTGTTLSWIIMGNLTQDLDCQVATVQGGITEFKCNSGRGLCQVKLEHLLPNTRYSTRVRCSVNGRRWGKWTKPISFTTYPLVTVDVWRKIKQLSDPNSRQVTLLWIPRVSDLAATVNIQDYMIQWSQDRQNWTKWKVSGQTQAEVPIDSGRYYFTIQAVLHTGSTVPAHITIPQKDNGEIRPVEKRLSSTAAGFNLSWEEQDTATCGYTVEWCILGIAVQCVLGWIKVPEGNNTLSLPERKFQAGSRYTFNIYECTENGHRLLEIQTGYSKELRSVQSPRLVEPAQSTSSSVALQWHFNENDLAHPAFITGYLVTVQEVGSDSLRDSYLVEDPLRKSVTIEGLQQSKEYTFSVSALTKEGPGQPASITVRTKTNYTAHLAKILTPILLLLCCTILLWPRRKTIKGIFAYPAGMNIKTPVLDSFLQETGERLQSQKVEDCISCDIEILSTRPPLTETITLGDPELLIATGHLLVPPGFQPSPSTLSLSCMLLQADDCPQSATELGDTPASLQMMCTTNMTYFYTTEEDLYKEKQVLFSEPSESQQESCSVVYGYISNDTL